MVKIYEKENDIFCEASGNNQNRLHLGFHYPRSLITRTQSIFGFNNFIKEYPNLSKKIKNNIYAIASDANNITDFGTYVQIMKSTNLKFKLLNPKKYKLFNVEGALSCKERMINSEKAKIFFKNKLYRNLVLNSEIKKIAKQKKKYVINNSSYDFVINCTWQQLKGFSNWNFNYEACLTFLYKPKFKNLPSITIMDGPFYTLYEWNKEFFNLYSVKSSILISTKNLVLAKKKIAQLDTKKKFLIRKKAEQGFEKFFPEFKKKFKFYGYLKTLKTIQNMQTHNRNVQVQEKNKFIDVLSGKIDHITIASKEVLKCVKKY